MKGEDKRGNGIAGAHESRLGGSRRKFVESKKKWSREGRLLTGSGEGAGRGEKGKENAGEKAVREGNMHLPPGQRLVHDWPVLDLGVQPEIPPDQWRLIIDGLVENPVQWNWKDLHDQPTFRDTSDMHCVTAWSRCNNHWEGVSAKHILSLVRPKPAAKCIVFHSYDGYTTNLPLSAFDDDDVLLATKWEGKPIPREHGGPVRVILPKLYLWKSAKWVKRIEFTAKDRRGFWEVRGYHNHGDPWREERYSWQEK